MSLYIREEIKTLGSFRDPVGAVYEADDRILRGIRLNYSDFYSRLLKLPPIRAMIGQEFIDTEVEPVGVPGFPLTLRHRKLLPVSFCYEWPAQMLKDAALLTLDICIKLADHGLTLKDASPWNILFEGPRPIFVDFTSIMPEDPNLPWVAYDQFCRLFFYPLILASFRSSKLSRALLRDQINGVPQEDLACLLPSAAFVRMPWLVERFYLPRFFLALIRRLSAEQNLVNVSTRFHPDARARTSFFRTLKRNVESIRLPNASSRWSKYSSDLSNFNQPSEFNRKQAAVAYILGNCRPKTVVDIGCNRGGYSILAANVGARVIAFDADDDSVAGLYHFAKKKQLDILPLVNDVLNPSPTCGWRAVEFPAAPQRLRAEMAMALALVHHLTITQHQPFERIVLALADYADKWLLTEFVPLDDPRSRELLTTNHHDLSWYTLENFLQALQRAFTRTELFPSYPDGRVLILCAR